MQKKYIYTAIAVVALVLGYLNYYGEEKPIPKTTSNTIETSDVVYESKDYKIEAKKQLDNLDSSETNFEVAKALFQNMNLSGDNVLIDKVRNLILEKNISGISSNGWEFTTEKAKYLSSEDKVYSESGVKAYNKDENIEISGETFETDTKMSYVKLRNNVKVENIDFHLESDEAYYDDESKIVTLTNNIKVESKAKEGSDLEGINGSFKEATYNTKTKILESNTDFVITYRGSDLHGRKLWYNQNTGDFKIWEDVRVVQGTSVVTMDRIENSGTKGIMTFYGPIAGKGKEYNLKADNGYYNTTSGIVSLMGSVEVVSVDGMKLVGDIATLDRTTNILKVDGNNKDVVMTSKDMKATSKNIKYNTETKELYLDQNYKIVTPEYLSQGEKLYYNNNTSKGVATRGDIKGANFYGKGDRVEFDTFNKVHSVIGNAKFESDGYILTGDRIDYVEATTIAKTIGSYTIKNSLKGETFKGVDGVYNVTSGELVAGGNITGNTPSYDFSGRDLIYNTKSKKGSIESNVKLVNKKDKSVLTGNRAKYQAGSFANIIGDVRLKTSDYTITGREATYKDKEGRVYIPGLVKIRDSKDLSGTMYDGVFDVAKNTYSGRNFRGTTTTSKVKGDIINYYLDKELVELEGAVELEDGEMKYVGERAKYYTQVGDIYGDKPFIIYYKNLVIEATRGRYNIQKESLDGENVVITSDKGEKLQGNQIIGSFLDKKIDIIGDVKARGYNGGAVDNIVDYTGDSARIYFIDDNGYRATRSEVRDNGVFKYQGMTLYSDYLEIDFIRKLALGRQGSRIVTGTGESVESEVADINLNTEIINLVGSVEMLDNGTRATANRGVIRNRERIVELEGDVQVENDSATVTSDRATYDMNTEKLDAKGNVFVNYKVK